MMKYQIKACGITHIGTGCYRQEDNFLLADGKHITQVEQTEFNQGQRHKVQKVCEFDAEHALFAIGDGMGGQNAGDLASEIAIKHLDKHRDRIVSHHHTHEALNYYQDMLYEMNESIGRRGKYDPCRVGIGTTLTTLLLHRDSVHAIHVGNSAMYYFNGLELRKMTKDHTEGQRLLDLGILREWELEGFPKRKNLYRYVGMPEEYHQVEADVSEMIPLQERQWFLLCSDGLSDMIEKKLTYMMRTCYGSYSIEEVANILVQESITEVKRKIAVGDNTTVLLIEIKK